VRHYEDRKGRRGRGGGTEIGNKRRGPRGRGGVGLGGCGWYGIQTGRGLVTQPVWEGGDVGGGMEDRGSLETGRSNQRDKVVRFCGGRKERLVTREKEATKWTVAREGGREKPYLRTTLLREHRVVHKSGADLMASHARKTGGMEEGIRKKGEGQKNAPSRRWNRRWLTRRERPCKVESKEKERLKGNTVHRTRGGQCKKLWRNETVRQESGSNRPSAERKSVSGDLQKYRFQGKEKQRKGVGFGRAERVIQRWLARRRDQLGGVAPSLSEVICGGWGELGGWLWGDVKEKKGGGGE